MNRIQKIIQEVLQEEKQKRDRCLRIADRKFDKPSAYKSGAVVRCRKGDIWKNIKETDDPQSGKAAPYGSGYSKLKDIIREILKENKLIEAKQVSTLYHYTTLESLKDIIISNQLLSNDPDFSGIDNYDSELDPNIDKGGMVAFTRANPKNAQFSIAQYADAVLVMDGDKLSNKYKIEPTQQYGVGEDEMEERIYNDITNLNKYLIKIILFKNNTKIESLLKEKNIPYETNLKETDDLTTKNNYITPDNELDFEQIKNDLIKIKPYYKSSLPNYLNNIPLTDNQINQLIELFTDNEADIFDSDWMTDADKIKFNQRWKKADIDDLSDWFIIYVEGLSDNWDELELTEKKLKEADNPQAGKAAPYGSGYSKLKNIIKEIIREDESLHKWFKRSGPKGKEGGWVDCNAPDGDGGYKACGRKEGEKRAKYPSCRPTPTQCKTPGKGKKWGKIK